MVMKALAHVYGHVNADYAKKGAAVCRSRMLDARSHAKQNNLRTIAPAVIWCHM